jgi:hypothetical protein
LASTILLLLLLFGLALFRLIGLILASFVGLLLICWALLLLLSPLLIASSVRLLLILLLLLPILIRLLLRRRRTVIASWLRPLAWSIRLLRRVAGLVCIVLLLLILLLLLPILIRLLLRRRRTVIASWLRPLAWSIRLRCVAGLVRIVRRCVGRLSRVAHCRLTIRWLIVRPVSVRRRRFSWRCLLHLWALRRNICRAHRLDFTSRERLTGMRRQLLLLFCERHGWRWRWCFCYHGTLHNRLRRFRDLIGG